MRQIKYNSIILTLLLLSACIKPYDPVIRGNEKSKYVVSGRITDTDGWQEVDVSRSSPIGSPGYIPVPACQVKVMDDKGNVFMLYEYNPGQYRTWMAGENLTPGTSYQVRVTTPDGEDLVSGFDKMPKGPALDSVYYILKDIPASVNPATSVKGMQFYVDVNAEGDYTQYYKWEVVETWEYHAAHPVEYFYNGSWNKVDPPDSTNITCWTTIPVKNVFTVSTKSLFHNTYKQYPLHTIDGTSSRLGVLYSMLVSQFAMGEKAFNYWEQLRINSNEQGGLYEKQPLAIKGNLVNETHPEQDVLGYFYAASERTRRYFYKDVDGVTLDFNNQCTEEGLGRGGWREFSPQDYPVYYYYPSTFKLLILSHECVDCRLLGGTTTKPEFWPK